MSRTVAKQLIKRLVSVLGFEIRRRGPLSADGRSSRDSLAGLLQQVRCLGWAPATVIDVGAAYGWFAMECHKVFPNVRYILMEPLAEYTDVLKSIAGTLSNAEHIAAAATAADGDVTINVHPDFVGSSVFIEEEESDVNGTPRRVPGLTLDSVKKERTLHAPYLLKIDVQGAELEVLKGAKSLLADTDYLILEVSLLEIFKGGPLLFDVVAYMKDQGFVVYDLYGLQYRPLDGGLSQLDIAFCKEQGMFRRHTRYATSVQREKQTQEFRTEYARQLRKHRVKQ